MRADILKRLYSLFPFDLRADCTVPPLSGDIRISCVINFFGRLDLLHGILCSLASQDYVRERFEVVLVEDRGGTPGGAAVAGCFSDKLQIVYAPLPENHGLMGASRNYGLSASRGEVILFLDDDTVILQQDFLSRLDDAFARHPEASAVVPHGRASFAVIEDRYDFHDAFFMTSRCTAYRRYVLRELGGFVSDFIGQEDVEFVIRFYLAGKKSVNVPELEYFHPPLLVPRLEKAKAVGRSFARLRGRYPLLLWLLVILNCGRHAPLYFLPGRKWKEMGRFGVGFWSGVFSAGATDEAAYR